MRALLSAFESGLSVGGGLLARSSISAKETGKAISEFVGTVCKFAFYIFCAN
jgi:hypothetical protein